VLLVFKYSKLLFKDLVVGGFFFKKTGINSLPQHFAEGQNLACQSSQCLFFKLVILTG